MIHERAVVSPQARLPEDIDIGAYAVIGPDVEIGAGSYVAEHVVLVGHCRLGERNRVFPFACLGAEPQDKKYAGEPTRVEIGNDNTIREFCTVNRGTAGGGGVTRLGDDNWIMAYVHIAHDCQIGSHVIMANNTTLAGHVVIEDYAVLGGFTKVHQYCRVGRHAFSGMDTGLNRDVPPYVTASGHLGTPKGINSEGLKRRGFTSQQIRNIRNAYKVLYRSDLKLAEAQARLEQLAGEQPELEPLVEFLRASERSIIR